MDLPVETRQDVALDFLDMVECNTADGVEERNAPAPSRMRIGCAGWTLPRESAGHFAGAGTHLERYSQTFNCCEINSSFHRPHLGKTWQRWAESVPDDFQFSVKVPKAISHEARLNCDAGLLSDFLRQISCLRDKLGPLLIQLPPSFLFDRAVAKRFFQMLRQQYAGYVVLEPRHSTWFDCDAADLLKELRISRVGADPACVPSAAEPVAGGGAAYFRLHGSPRRYYSSYSAEFLEAMAERLTRLAAQNPAWCIFDNTASGSAAPNALRLRELTKR